MLECDRWWLIGARTVSDEDGPSWSTRGWPASCRKHGRGGEGSIPWSTGGSLVVVVVLHQNTISTPDPVQSLPPALWPVWPVWGGSPWGLTGPAAAKTRAAPHWPDRRRHPSSFPVTPTRTRPGGHHSRRAQNRFVPAQVWAAGDPDRGLAGKALYVVERGLSYSTDSRRSYTTASDQSPAPQGSDQLELSDMMVILTPQWDKPQPSHPARILRGSGQEVRSISVTMLVVEPGDSLKHIQTR